MSVKSFSTPDHWVFHALPLIGLILARDSCECFNLGTVDVCLNKGLFGITLFFGVSWKAGICIDAFRCLHRCRVATEFLEHGVLSPLVFDLVALVNIPAFIASSFIVFFQMVCFLHAKAKDQSNVARFSFSSPCRSCQLPRFVYFFKIVAMSLKFFPFVVHRFLGLTIRPSLSISARDTGREAAALYTT